MSHKHRRVSKVSRWVREARRTEDRLMTSCTGGQEAATLTDGEGSREVAIAGCTGAGTDQEGQTDSLPVGNLPCLVCRGGTEVHLSNDDFRSDHFVTCKTCHLRYTLILKGFQLWYQRQLVKFQPRHFSVQPWEGAFTSQPPGFLIFKMEIMKTPASQAYCDDS